MSVITITTQIFLQRLSLRLAAEAGDEILDYEANGITFTALQRESAINRSVEQIYENILNGFIKAAGDDIQNGANAMLDSFDTFKTDIDYIITGEVPNSKLLAKPANVRKVKSLLVNSTSPVLITGRTATPLTSDQYHRAMGSGYSNYEPTSKKPRFYERDKTIELSIDRAGTIISEGAVQAVCLAQPVYTAFSLTGNDILAPAEWEDNVISTAKIKIFGGRQK